MNIQQLYYVLEVHRLGSISATAKELFISQPSLSNAIKQLETELGITIFERTHSGVVVTPKGMDLIDKAQDIVSEFNALGERYKTGTNNKKSLNVVTMPCLQVNEAFKKLCNYYRDEHEISFSLSTSLGDSTLFSLASNESDLGIVYITDTQLEEYLLKVDNSGLEFNKLATLQTYICIDEDDELAKKETLELGDLENHAIVYNRTSMFLDTINSLLKVVEPSSDEMQHRKTISTNSKQLNYEMLKCTKAFFLGTSLDVADLAKMGIASIPSLSHSTLTLGYIHRKHKPLSPLSEQFLKLFEEMLGFIK